MYVRLKINELKLVKLKHTNLLMFMTIVTMYIATEIKFKSEIVVQQRDLKTKLNYQELYLPNLDDMPFYSNLCYLPNFTRQRKNRKQMDSLIVNLDKILQKKQLINYFDLKKYTDSLDVFKKSTEYFQDSLSHIQLIPKHIDSAFALKNGLVHEYNKLYYFNLVNKLQKAFRSLSSYDLCIPDILSIPIELKLEKQESVQIIVFPQYRLIPYLGLEGYTEKFDVDGSINLPSDILSDSIVLHTCKNLRNPVKCPNHINCKNIPVLKLSDFKLI